MNSSRLTKLEKQVSAMEEELREVYCKDLPKGKSSPSDKLWLCEKCGSRIGILDNESNNVRIRYKDFVLYWKPARNGVLTVICRSCSYQNKRIG